MKTPDALSVPPKHNPGVVPTEPDADRIARRAYEIWDQEGRPTNQAEEHWKRAEQEVRGKIPAVDPAYAKVEARAREAYANDPNQVPRVSAQKKHWLEAEAEMREREKPHPLPPSKAPLPEDPIEPVAGGQPAGQE